MFCLLDCQSFLAALVRTTVDAAAVAAAVVQPAEAFTADPPPADDAIRWTPSAAETGR
jgi:hypothetical protein